MMEQTVAHEKVSANAGVNSCIGGVIALVVGIFAFGVPCGLLAVHLGKEGITHGASTFGTVVKICGWVEVVITAIGVLAMTAAKFGMH